jgi:hypothetical protein
MNPYRININSTHTDSLPIAVQLIDAQQRADAASADIVLANPGSVMQLVTAVRMNNLGANGGLEFVYRAASIVGVPRAAGIVAYHRLLADGVAAATAEAFAVAVDAIDAAAAIRNPERGIHAEAIGSSVRVVDNNTGADTTYNTAAAALAALEDIDAAYAEVEAEAEADAEADAAEADAADAAEAEAAQADDLLSDC